MRVYLWGFREDDVQHWPPDLEPIFATEWPLDAPIVVHAGVVAHFQQAAAAQPLPNGRLPDAILYLPAGTEAPEGTAAYFDAVVEAEDWQALRDLLSCPAQFQMAELVHELPATFLDTLERPIAELVPEELPFSDQIQHTLKTSRPCWEAFLQALEERLWVRGHLWRPTDLVAVEHSWESWLAIPLQVRARLRAGQARLQQVLEALVGGCGAVGLIPVGAAIRTTHKASGTAEVDEFKSLLEDLQSGKPCQLLREYRDVTLGWDTEHQALSISRLRGKGKRRVKDFRIEMRHGDTVLWGKDSEEEKVAVPLSELQRAVRQGAKLFILVTEEQVAAMRRTGDAGF